MLRNKDDYAGIWVQNRTEDLGHWGGDEGGIICMQGWKCPKCGEISHKYYHCWKDEEADRLELVDKVELERLIMYSKQCLDEAKYHKSRYEAKGKNLDRLLFHDYLTIAKDFAQSAEDYLTEIIIENTDYALEA